MLCSLLELCLEFFQQNLSRYLTIIFWRLVESIITFKYAQKCVILQYGHIPHLCVCFLSDPGCQIADFQNLCVATGCANYPDVSAICSFVDVANSHCGTPVQDITDFAFCSKHSFQYKLKIGLIGRDHEISNDQRFLIPDSISLFCLNIFCTWVKVEVIDFKLG